MSAGPEEFDGAARPLPRRIVHAIHSFPPESRGGTENYVEGLAQMQRDAGVDARVLSGSDDAAYARLEPSLPPVSRLPTPDRTVEYALLGESERLAGEVERRLTDWPPDLVHVHHWHNLTSDLVRRCVARGIPVVVTLHDLFATCPLFFRLPNPTGEVCRPDLSLADCGRCVAERSGWDLESATAGVARRQRAFVDELTAASAVLALSASQLDFLAAIPWLRDVAVRVVELPSLNLHNPTDFRRDAATIERIHDVQPRLRLVSWGGLLPGKGLGTVVDACARVADRAAVEIHHYGRVLDHGFAADLESRAEGALTLHGPFDAADLAAVLRGYDAAVFASFYMETHGFVVDEALALGLPVIVSDRGAPSDRIGDCGLSFPAGDVDALANLLAGLMSHPERLAAMRASSPPPRPGWAQHCRDIDAIYRQALRGDHRPRVRPPHVEGHDVGLPRG